MQSERRLVNFQDIILNKLTVHEKKKVEVLFYKYCIKVRWACKKEN